MLEEAIARKGTAAVPRGHDGTAACPRGVVELVYELMDAHEDTARLAARTLDRDPTWLEHLDYIRQLQRVGREALAVSSGERHD
jgi:hypothetical protein